MTPTAPRGQQSRRTRGRRAAAALVSAPLLWFTPAAAVPAGAATVTPADIHQADTYRAGADPAERADGLRADIDAILADPMLEGATSGVVVTDAVTGEVLYSEEAGTRLLPASNMKPFTTAAALQVLGADHTFGTEAVVERRPGRGAVDELYLVGGGDPALDGADLYAMAAEVAASGVTSVGDLYADDSWFDDERLVDDWWPEDEPYAYSAQISALTVAHGDRHDTGVTEVTVTATGDGEPVSVDPGAAAGYVELDNRAVTGSAGGEDTLVVDRPVGTNTIEVTGSLPVDAGPRVVLRTVDEPAGLAGHLFAQALEEHGVAVGGEVAQAEVPDEWHRPRVVAEHTSPPLEELLVPLVKFSNNGHAEMLVKSIGREVSGEGAWGAGLAAQEAALRDLGVDTSDLVLTDGSGLSRGNRVTADTVVDLLARAQEAPWYEVWHHSLPVAGDSDPFVGGTLARRMGGTPAAGAVQAKTGTMTGVSALSGYVQGPGGELYFSVVNNGHSGYAPTRVQDAIAVRLAEHLGNRIPEQAALSRHGAVAGGGELECSWELTC
ncbi:D-alanyl-D-alanine carboxypeptidase DacC [Nocardiopsis terrae]|uniref:D-alanyl-D-alanine carboxypeptidase/D-alanyl-D-alanine-endopeptidase (Penicillin-binding protein 4) n=1 Tax=Nocardiopsis terrae TaxID=372655 RepID=A0ABR9HNH6_9ACTN|nr:D-alanyl-D-alanine carboxypeptidase/D-alanyl-D-alanine-endopeptidase [Nocardiopsis terrae]MBE1460562.1 D-alanyl-D-alanine carboxypeptidase/D-alanyl-D-alanine-endopeptidase (penicillin-binding protein 4) [Nocardiopsis terrae]GHC72115.1 D-alanyl-D-alanine carboxypeptidase DacC [Nocardiopsis terrae]